MDKIEISVEELFEKRGTIDVVVVEKCTGKVISLALMDINAFNKTIETGKVHYYDPYNNVIYLKGEHSGKIEKILDIELDFCSARRHKVSLLIKVEMEKGDCLFGMSDCYFYKYENGKFVINKDKIYNHDSFNKYLDRLGIVLDLEEEKENFKKRFNK